MGPDDENFLPTPEKSSIPQRMDRASDTDFAVAPESGPDEDSEAPDPAAIDPRKLEIPASRGGGITGALQSPSQIRQGRPNRKLIILRLSPRKSIGVGETVSPKKTATQKTAPLSKTISSKTGGSQEGLAIRKGKQTPEKRSVPKIESEWFPSKHNISQKGSIRDKVNHSVL